MKPTAIGARSLPNPSPDPSSGGLAEAARIADTPIALICFVDGDRQWFKARMGLEATEAFGEQFGAAHHRQYAAIVRALNEGRQPPVAGADAIGSLRTIERIYESISFAPTGEQELDGVV